MAPAAAPDGAADGHEHAKDYLSLSEMARLLDAAKAGRHGVRDHLLLLMIYRHGLRVSEAIGLRRDELDLDRARLWVRRLKGGLSVEQPIAGDELRAIKRYLATRTDALPWLFVSERGQPLTRQSVNYLIGAAAGCAGLPGVHPHMLRHSCRFALADKGQGVALVHFDGLNDGRMLFPLFGSDRTDAAQAQRRSPSPHPEDVVQGAELAGV